MTNILILLSLKVLKELIQKDVADLNVQEKYKFHSGTIMYLVKVWYSLYLNSLRAAGRYIGPTGRTYCKAKVTFHGGTAAK